MKQIQITITEDEVKDYAKGKLHDEQVSEILTAVETDECLWNDIKESINSAIKYVVKK